MKTIYLIRHGQSHGNRSLHIQQTEYTELNERGLRQAKEVARHMKRLPLEAIVSSTFVRAKTTAAELSKETGIPVEYSDLFIEYRRPSVQLRKRKVHPHWLWAQLKLVLTGKHSDEETPEELLVRAHNALAYLQHRPESLIAVVTHGTFMRAVYAAITYGEGVTGRMYLRATRGMHTRNTALMIAQHNGEEWKVTAWNADAREV